ncbi:hypothetical protein, conserved [Babesia ovata]|uniref:6-Cys domain-containing protein n=1 Tax=Babesia ovata TaxID=189622 RepID=A0A2H6KHM1_9APIC|nr:uncharacterized protein BOVATA_039900 [Babesia ovata]GBE62497.1 hypothetical protein, conserved [Babesia ovata]
MATSHVLRALLAFCAIWLHRNSCTDALLCDFADPDELLISNALVSCHMDIDDFDSATFICPRRVNDTEYVWHPQPTSTDHYNINTYVSENGMLRSLALSNVFVTDAPVAFASVESYQSQTSLYFNIPIHELFAVTDHRLIFICGPQDLILSPALQRRLDGLDGFAEMQEFPWSATTPLTAEIAKIGNGAGLGVVFLYRGHLTLLLQGCGSRPSPLFAATNEVTVDPVTGIRSCVADPMSRSPIGFLCEGGIEPADCMRYLLDPNGEVVAAPEPYSYTKFYNEHWVVAQYFSDLALPPFHGECRCIDSETGQDKARIEIRSKADYICDISSKIFQNRVRPIRGHWCSVVLHPGSTLTIRFPIEEADTETSYEEPLPGTLSQKPPRYLFKTGFQPTDLVTLRQLMTHEGFNFYYEASYRKAIAGDALELDVSQMALGEIKLKYHFNEPLSLRLGPNSFFFHWTLKAINKYVFHSIQATVNVSFAFTHRYAIVGCDRGQRNVFHRETSRNYCSTKWMGNGIGKTYECLYQKTPHIGIVGIYCRPGEELLPDNCESTAYNLYSNRIIPFPANVRSATSYPIRGFQIFDIAFHNISALSCACICVDQLGYEKSRLILQSNNHEYYIYKINRRDGSHALFPYALLPWREVGSSTDETNLLRSLMLYNISTSSVTLHVGKTLWLECGLGSEAVSSDVQSYVANNGRIAASWLPYNAHYFYYTVNHIADGPELIRKTYGDSIATTPGGFRAVDDDTHQLSHQRLIFESHINAVLVSKDPVHKNYVPISFVCGKAPEPSDMSVITGEISASAVPHVTETSARYTWHLVQVAVETTDPYMQGCGVTYLSTELFRPETPKLYYPNIRQPRGCKIDFQTAGEAAFYCPVPYLLDPPNCFSQVYVDDEVKNLSDLSMSLVSSHSNHFVILSFDASHVGPGETLRQTSLLECRCVTIKGVILSTMQIGNYYSK